jgi:carbonic anhydrase
MCAECIPNVVNAATDTKVVDIVTNGGGTATDDTLRSLALSEWAHNTTELIVIGHTGCKFLPSTDDYQRIQMAAYGRELSVDSVDDVAQVVASTVASLRSRFGLRFKRGIHGLVYDVERGAMICVN